MKANKFAEILHVVPRTRPPLLVTSPHKIVMWFDRNALVTRLVCFSRSIEIKSSLFANIFLYIDDENSVTISETREYISRSCYFWLFVCNFPGQFGFLNERVFNFVIMFMVNVVNSFQSMF